MIKLLEHEGKALLSESGIAIPEGALFGAMPEELDGDLVVKAQIFAGGRGKAGGVRFARGREEALCLARELMGRPLGESRVEDVYIERRLDIVQEFYLAALVDRDSGIPVLLASAEGGVDIEEVAAGRILRQRVDPLLGLEPFMTARLARALGLAGETADAFVKLAVQLHRALVSQDAELIEVNPLALTRDGGFVAADAKVILDEDAAFRHPGRRARPQGTDFEMAARALDVIGVETGPRRGVAAIMNGAGLTMATLDEVIALGGVMSGVIELHGATMQGPERIADVIGCILDKLDPSVVLINIHFQFRSLETIAEGIVLALRRWPALTPDRVILRLRGEKESEARAVLAGAGLDVMRDFGPACLAAVARTRAV